MRVSVRLFASFREAAGIGRFELEVPEGATVREAVERVVALHPSLGGTRSMLLARGREYVATDATLSEGDELALIPPVSGGATAQRERVLVSGAPLALDRALEAVRSDGHGAYVTFVGAVRDRNRGRRVTRLEYEAYAEMAEARMRAIAARIEADTGAVLALHHRVGDLAVGEVAVVVAAGAAHRDAAFAAARRGIDELKREVPIWKKEHGEDGAVWIEDHA